MARLYADENFPFPTIQHLRDNGHDVLTTQQAGKAGLAIPDEQVLAFATSERRAVVTLNRQHFIRLHRLNDQHEGIIVCTFDRDFKNQALRIDAAISERPLLKGVLLRVNRS